MTILIISIIIFTVLIISIQTKRQVKGMSKIKNYVVVSKKTGNFLTTATSFTHDNGQGIYYGIYKDNNKRSVINYCLQNCGLYGYTKDDLVAVQISI